MGRNSLTCPRQMDHVLPPHAQRRTSQKPSHTRPPSFQQRGHVATSCRRFRGAAAEPPEGPEQHDQTRRGCRLRDRPEGRPTWASRSCQEHPQ